MSGKRCRGDEAATPSKRARVGKDDATPPPVRKAGRPRGMSLKALESAAQALASPKRPRRARSTSQYPVDATPATVTSNSQRPPPKSRARDPKKGARASGAALVKDKEVVQHSGNNDSTSSETVPSVAPVSTRGVHASKASDSEVSELEAERAAKGGREHARKAAPVDQEAAKPTARKSVKPAADKASKEDKASKKMVSDRKSLSRGGGVKGQGSCAKGGNGTKGVRPVSSKAGRKAKAQLLLEVEHDGQTFRVGDVVYVVLDEDAFEVLDKEEEDEPCDVCEGTECGQKRNLLVECSRCLRGFHQKCVDPPLKVVPPGDWDCPRCVQGVPPPSRDPCTAREIYFQTANVLELCIIEALWSEDDGEAYFTANWFCRPEDTHTGRQKHHGAREVFLSLSRNDNPVSSILRPAFAPPPNDFNAAAEEGDDVFLCEYIYDQRWHRFCRRSEAMDLETGVQAGGPALGPCFKKVSLGDCDEDYESDDSGDGQYDPKADLADKVRARGSTVAGSGARGRGGARQGGDKWASQLQQTAVRFGMDSVPQRGGDEVTGSALTVAQGVLSLAARPRCLPCRDAEKKSIRRFVTDCIKQGNESGTLTRPCLYIAGVPGTGKTATVLEVLRGLITDTDSGKLPAFQFVEVNALRLPTAQHAYSKLLEVLTGRKNAPGTARILLEDLFSGSGRPASARLTVVLMDEIDMLATRDQSVLYNLFGWPLNPGAKLAIIGVANTLDLPERLLPRIASRLGQSKLVFEPYNKEQIKTIVKARLVGIEPAFKDIAIELAARKVSSVNGDVRRALELLRRAADLLEQDQGDRASASEENAELPDLVTPHYVTRAFQEMFNAVHMQVVTSLPDLDQIFLASMILEIKYTGLVDCTVAAVSSRLTTFWKSSRQHDQVSHLGGGARSGGESEQGLSVSSVLPPGAALGCARRLEALKVIFMGQSWARWGAVVTLNVATDDILHVLKQNARLEWLHSFL